MRVWPGSAAELAEEQEELGALRPPLWRPGGPGSAVAGCFVCFARGLSGAGAAGDPGWAGAALVRDRSLAAAVALRGEAGASYAAGLLALREGPLLEAAVRSLPERPEVLIVNATGRDHPRRAGLTLHLGAVLDLPTVGVTHQPLLAEGEWPADRAGATASLSLAGEVVGYWVRAKRGVRPLAVHAAWRTDADTAVEVVLAATERTRTPEPLRLAREAARRARAGRARAG